MKRRKKPTVDPKLAAAAAVVAAVTAVGSFVFEVVMLSRSATTATGTLVSLRSFKSRADIVEFQLQDGRAYEWRCNSSPCEPSVVALTARSLVWSLPTQAQVTTRGGRVTGLTIGGAEMIDDAKDVGRQNGEAVLRALVNGLIVGAWVLILTEALNKLLARRRASTSNRMEAA